ncbi:MAG: TRAP transporter permease [Deltaproteobacteria bacterium]|nr:TRAP transporter permease [Deltaproteobacteria bacterium]
MEDKEVKIESPREKSILRFLAREKGLSSGKMIGGLIGGVGVMLALFHLTTSTFGQADARVHGGTHLGLILALTFLLFPLKRKSFRDKLNAYSIVDLFLFLASIGISIYANWDTGAMEMRTGMPNQWDILLGTIFIIMILEAARRTMGWAIVLVALFFLLHVLFAPYYPGIFYGPPFPWSTAIDIIFLQNNGIYGIPIQVMAFYIILFMYFGAFLQQTKAGDFFINLSMSLAGRTAGGPAKVAVISSGLFGTISGSAVANVLGTGSFTIPMMKRIGYPANYAGAVEACASTGGMIMPPVMGATAFLIAEFLGISYWSVCVAAFIPAVLYYISVFMMVHFEARKLGLKPLRESEIPRLKDVLPRGYTVISLALMIVLFALGYSVVWACLAGVGSIIAVSFISRETRMSPEDFTDAFINGSRSALMVATACAVCGIIIGSIFITGVGQRFTSLVLSASHGQLWAALLLTAVAAYILGMGMPPAAVYLTLAILVIPALIKMGISTMASHMFAFYFGIIAAITPPVAMAAFAGAALSGGNPARTGYIAMRIGIASYIIPFIFAYCPELLFQGPYHQILLAFCTATIGAISLAAGVEGWLFYRCTYFQRALMLAAALLLIKPGIITDLLGLALFGSVILMQKGWKKSREEAPGLSWEPGLNLSPETILPSPPERSSGKPGGLSPASGGSRSETWKGWILFLTCMIVAFLLTYKGIHFTRYWLFLAILAGLSFMLVVGHGLLMKTRNPI